MTSVMWFRRDLRTADNPALLAALADGPTLPLFVLDPALWDPSGLPRRAYLVDSLRALRRDVPVSVLHGDPVRRVVETAQEVGATSVHVAADYGPYGRRRDEAVAEALEDAGIELVRTGSPYAVAPDRVKNGSDQSYKVFTPFSRAWAAHGWRDPAGALPDDARWRHLKDTVDLPDVALPDGIELPTAGEAAANEAWHAFLDKVTDYDDARDKPGVEGTSRMSHHLKYGEIHPRTILADLAGRQGAGATTYRQEIAWREFYADVLFQRPDTARDYLRPEFAKMQYDAPGADFEAWQEGRTGYPIVDAGMRQLRATGWMHNRVRMITASFLVKDLHVEWQHGARHFLQWLVDGDLASNNHGWQWTAGSGTDASPFFRVFNPTSQGRKFDPSAAYVRQWVPELADVDDPHEPSSADRKATGYPEPVVDHKAERQEALDRYQQIKA
ncbi:cryptochrome/photolyase family protein [Nocardioides rubriscoriae]|uniref:cryptochrome/photolyase family protein n=1 Tax=Nocardioides rubriscoriae TaxID=642762 RepID=UPI001FE9A28A|nr:deoxyribodipyrimidine photo-lyase [Nocardioides rubriscoriae]